MSRIYANSRFEIIWFSLFFFGFSTIKWSILQIFLQKVDTLCIFWVYKCSLKDFTQNFFWRFYGKNTDEILTNIFRKLFLAGCISVNFCSILNNLPSFWPGEQYLSNEYPKSWSRKIFLKIFFLVLSQKIASFQGKLTLVTKNGFKRWENDRTKWIYY